MFHIKQLEQYKISNVDQLTPKLIATLVRRFKKNELPRLKKLQEYYLGEHDILKRRFSDVSKPNNKLVNNFASQIVDTTTGYFLGRPVTYHTATNKDLMREIQRVFDENHEQKHNTMLSSASSITGVSYELVYINEQNKLKIAFIDPCDVFLIYDDTIEQNVLAAVHLIESLDYETNKTKTSVVVYTDSEIVTYDFASSKANETDRTVHYFGQVPIIAYFNNQYHQSAFEDVVTLIDNYNSILSDGSNDIEMFSDSYMVFKGLDIEKPEDLAEMKQNRAIQFADKEGDVSFLTKSVANEPVIRQREILKEMIALFSGVPDMQSASFGANISAISIAMKMQPLEQKVAIKENYFSEGLDKRLELITTYLNISRIDSTKYDYAEISYKFKRNVPINLHEYGQFAINARGILSDETIISNMPFIDDVQEELDKLKAQYNDSMTDYQSYEAEMSLESSSQTRKQSETSDLDES